MAERLRVGVRYCGGCNPRYDRVATVKEFASRFENVDFVSAAPGLLLNLLICGCSAQCTEKADLDGEILSLYHPQHFEQAELRIRKLSAQLQQK